MRAKKGIWLMIGGLLLIAAALFLVCYNLLEERRANDTAGQLLEEIAEQSSDPEEGAVPDYQLNPDMEMPAVDVGDYECIGTLEIPVLGISLPVISDWSYPKLKVAPCRYTGSAYQGDLVIAAHNYRTHFGQIRDLDEGDHVLFTDMDGNMFVYEVAWSEILGPEDTEEMVSGDWDLTLFTCTWGGASRVTVRCVAAED